VTFRREGEYPYFCDFHYNIGMQGSIVVDDSLFRNSFE
jgi:plastocyanin